MGRYTPSQLLWCEWKQKEWLGLGKQWQESVVCDVYRWEERPQTVDLRDIPGDQGGDPCRCCHEGTELRWPGQRRRNVEERHGGWKLKLGLGGVLALPAPAPARLPRCGSQRIWLERSFLLFTDLLTLQTYSSLTE